MKKAGVAVVVTSFLAGLALLTMWLYQEEPRNKDGYLYRDYLQHAALSDSIGSIVFNETRKDTFSIYMSGDTLVVEAPDSTIYLPDTSPPPIPLPFKYTVAIVTARVLLFGLQPDRFHSVYRFPPDSTGQNVWEIWEGTEPGKQGEEPDSTEVTLVHKQELLYGWVEEEPDTHNVYDDSTLTTYPVEFTTFKPIEAAIYDTEESYFILTDSIPYAVVDTTHLQN
jgi:hypothetical protein